MSSKLEKPEIKEVLSRPQFEVRQEKSLEFVARSMKNYEDVGDKEAVFMLALILDHPEWKDEILRQMEQYKPHVKNPEKILERIREDYSKLGQKSEAASEAEDTIWWADHLPEAEARIQKLIAYFHPQENAVMSRVVIIPSDRILPSKDTGRSFHVGGTAVIMSHTENLDNLEHEFLHGIINPLTERLAETVPQEKIISLASNRYKEDEMYGDHALSLLNESLIRTYNDLIKKGKPIRTFEDFEKLFSSLSESRFAEFIEAEPRTKARLETMRIHSLDDFKRNIKEYYDRYMKDELGERVYKLYERFNLEKSVHPDVRFEDFLSREISELFA
jgi:hypothetical protein